MTQGLEVFQEQVSKIADLGRYEDTYIAHVAEGETVVPMDVLDSNPQLKTLLFNQMLSMGIDPEQYIVGNELNSINPVTGQPEFFLKKIFKSAKKALKKIAPYAGTIAGIMGLGPGYAAMIGAGAPLLAGQGAGTALAGGLGGYGAGKLFGTGLIGGGGGATDTPIRKFQNMSQGSKSFSNLGKPTPIPKVDPTPKGNLFSNMFKSKQDKIAEAYERYERYPEEMRQQLAMKAGEFQLPGGALTATLAPMAIGAIGQYFDKDEPSKLDKSFYETNPEATWMGQFGNVQRSAYGGEIDYDKYAGGGDIEYEDAYAGGGLSSLDEFPRMNGQISGPGGPKEDLVPAMLSDGEFVMTARAVENAGGPQAMYNLMNRLDPESSRGVM